MKGAAALSDYRKSRSRLLPRRGRGTAGGQLPECARMRSGLEDENPLRT
jgi:hypothetical protein